MTRDNPLVAIAMGDPAGIGGEIVVKASAHAGSEARLFVVGDADVLRDQIDSAALDLAINPINKVIDAHFEPGVLDVVDLDNVDEIEYGVVRGKYGAASLDYIETTLQMLTDGLVDAVATGPVNAESMDRSGEGGMSELIQKYYDSEQQYMLLVRDTLRIAHLTLHVSLSEACDQVSTERLSSLIHLLEENLSQLGIQDPVIGVAGLNPHAGLGGVYGDVDVEEIAPAVQRAKDRGCDVVGPESPDVVFADAVRGRYDGVVAMYHDQGHIPIKLLDATGERPFSTAAVRLGLPFPFTTVAHGTAFEIAGKGKASPAAMQHAIRLAAQLASDVS